MKHSFYLVIDGHEERRVLPPLDYIMKRAIIHLDNATGWGMAVWDLSYPRFGDSGMYKLVYSRGWYHYGPPRWFVRPLEEL